MRAAARRFALALLAIGLSVPLVLPSLAQSLVARGDTLRFAGETSALEKYRLALALDPSNLEAADRISFSAFLSRDPARLRAALDLVTPMLSRRDDTALLLDRALIRHLLKQYRGAARDFSILGERGNRLAARLARADRRSLTGERR